MRALLILALLSGCPASMSSMAPDMGGDDLSTPPGTRSLKLLSTDYSITPGPAGEFYQCQRVTLTEDVYITKITPTSQPGLHHEVLAIDEGGQPDGVSTCGPFAPKW